MQENLGIKINIFISHVLDEFKSYKIKEIAEYLENQPEINRVFFCEADLIGNIDDFMEQTIAKSQLILFIATQKSALRSRDCLEELKIGFVHGVAILPIKGADISWKDLASIGLIRELGFDLDFKNFNMFLAQLYSYILEFIKYYKNELLEKERIIDSYGKRFGEILNSSKFNQFYVKNKEEIRKVINNKDNPDTIFYNMLAEFTGKGPLSEDHEEQCKAFISYATEDSDYFKIKPISEGLEKYKDVVKAFYWEKDLNSNAIVYMNKYIGESEILILFCSPNAYKSWLVELEWSAAVQLQKAIIPVFVNEKCIPPILSSMYGVQIGDIENTEKLTKEIHSLIVKRMREKKERNL